MTYDHWKSTNPADEELGSAMGQAETSCEECEKMRARIIELEKKIADIVTTRKVTLRAPAGIPVTIAVDIDTLLANEFLAKRIDEVDWGKGYNVRVRSACENNGRWMNIPERKIPERKSEPIVTVADLILAGRLPYYHNVGTKTEERVRQVLREHGLSFDDQARLEVALKGQSKNKTDGGI
jgi:hypothetical protein